MGASVHVLTSDSALQRALTSQIERSQPEVLLDGGAEDSAQRTEIVITTVMECEPERCERLTMKGAMVIVLAAIPRDTERAKYLRAGAVAYVPMSVDSRELMAEIRRLTPRIDRVIAGATACNGRI